MIWIQLLVTLITAFGGAYFGAWLNKNRYYQEKWWDRKADACVALTRYVRKFLELAKQNDENIFGGQFNLNAAEQNKTQLYRLTESFSFDLVESKIFLPNEVSSKLYTINGIVERYVLHTDISGMGKEDLFLVIAQLEGSLHEHNKQLTQMIREDLQKTNPFT